MNPYRNTHLNSYPSDDVTAPDSLESPPPYSHPDTHDDSSHRRSLSATLPSPPIQTGHSYLTVLGITPSQESSGPVPPPDRSTSPLPAWDQGFNLRSELQSSLAPVLPPVQTQSAVSAPTVNPYTAPSTPPSYQVSVIIPSPDICLSPHQPQCSEETCPDLECSICFSQFNNVFRCPKMLQCRHTFCLECLARINVKSTQPNAIQCPLCRGLTPLPALGLPRLATDSNVLAYLPATMQRVYSIRFLRNKGKLQVKRSSGGRWSWGHRSLTSLRSLNPSLDVGRPNLSSEGNRESGSLGGALFRLTGRPLCRAFLLMSVVMMLVLLTGIIVFLFTFRNDGCVTMQKKRCENVRRYPVKGSEVIN